VPRLGLKARIGNRTVLEIAREVLAAAEAGLAARDRENGMGDDERVYLATLRNVVDSGRTAAEDWLDRYRGPWAGSVEPVFFEAAY
jgi:glutamate--cysteine ligase